MLALFKPLALCNMLKRVFHSIFLPPAYVKCLFLLIYMFVHSANLRRNALVAVCNLSLNRNYARVIAAQPDIVPTLQALCRRYSNLLLILHLFRLQFIVTSPHWYTSAAKIHSRENGGSARYGTLTAFFHHDTIPTISIPFPRTVNGSGVCTRITHVLQRLYIELFYFAHKQ